MWLESWVGGRSNIYGGFILKSRPFFQTFTFQSLEPEPPNRRKVHKKSRGFVEFGRPDISATHRWLSKYCVTQPNFKTQLTGKMCAIGSINSHYFHIIGDKTHQPKSVGVYIPIIRIPIKRWDDHPQYCDFWPWHMCFLFFRYLKLYRTMKMIWEWIGKHVNILMDVCIYFFGIIKLEMKSRKNHHEAWMISRALIDFESWKPTGHKKLYRRQSQSALGEMDTFEMIGYTNTLSPIITEVENYPKWKETILLEIHPFSLPWLWVEG